MVSSAIISHARVRARCATSASSWTAASTSPSSIIAWITSTTCAMQQHPSHQGSRGPTLVFVVRVLRNVHILPGCQSRVCLPKISQVLPTPVEGAGNFYLLPEKASKSMHGPRTLQIRVLYVMESLMDVSHYGMLPATC